MHKYDQNESFMVWHYVKPKQPLVTRESGLCLLLSIFTRKKQTLISFDRRNDEEISVNFKNLKNDKITPACI